MKTYFFTTLIVCVLLLIGSCQKQRPNEDEPKEIAHENENLVELTAAQSKLAGVELGAIEQKQISGTIKVNGVLDVPPQQLVSVSVPLGGFMKSTTLLEGSRVRKGEAIAVIENLEFIQIQQDYLEARSQFELASADYARQQELAKENVNSQKSLQQAKNTFQTWEARYNALREKLKIIHVDIKGVEEGKVKSTVNLYSPIDGYVTKVNVNTGKFVNPTDVLFEIVDTRHLHAELIVFERDVPKLKIGQKVRFTLANESEERMASIYLIGRAIEDDRTVQIHCHIENEDTDLLPGMFLSALVETGGATVPALPTDAVVNFQGHKYVYIAVEEDAHGHTGELEANQHFSMLEISTGKTELGYTEVLVPDSLKNSSFVTKGAYELLSKMKNTEEGHSH